jgi:hypothetical protein
LEFIHAYYYLIIVSYIVNLFGILKSNIIYFQMYRLIELVAYQYQEVVSTVLEATMEGMEKLSMLRVEQCEDGDRPRNEV